MITCYLTWHKPNLFQTEHQYFTLVIPFCFCLQVVPMSISSAAADYHHANLEAQRHHAVTSGYHQTGQFSEIIGDWNETSNKCMSLVDFSNLNFNFQYPKTITLVD